jgi:hypothetical protein
MEAIKFFVGFDSRRPNDYSGTVRSILDHCPDATVTPLLLPHLRALGLYTRPTSEKDGILFDEISAAPMSTEFAISRFLVPFLCGFKGKAVFVDGDFMFRADPSILVESIEPGAAVAVVKHNQLVGSGTKMDGQPQTNYHRKNWSSLIVFNCEHPANAALTPEHVNAVPGRYLHAFAWLNDIDIQGLPFEWNWLEGYDTTKRVPNAVHYTRGTPDVIGYDLPFADEWRKIQERIA